MVTNFLTESLSSPCSCLAEIQRLTTFDRLKTQFQSSTLGPECR